MARASVQNGLVGSVWLCVMGLALCCVAGSSQVDVPYSPAAADVFGDHWTINPTSIGQAGNQPVYTDLGNVFINSSQPTFGAGQATLDASGELDFDSMSGNGYSITRRVKVSDDGSTVRVADVITTNQQTMRGIWYGTHLQMPVRSVEPVAGGNGLTGYIVEDLQGRAVVEIWGKADATLSLKIDPHGGNNGILVSDGGAALPVSDRAPIVIVHFHAIAANLAAARALAASLDSEKILADFPPEIRDRACNFLPSTQMLSLPDLLTGDALDVVELSSGQRLRGMLEEKSIKVVGVLGPVEVPMDSLLGITTSAVREGDRSVATCGGDVLRGRLDLSFLHLRQTDGTVDEVPESQIARLGIHERPASTRPADSAWISTAGGDRLDIETPAEAVEIRTRCGTLKLDASHLAEIDFCSPGHDAHQIVLTDGSRLSGIISALSLSVKPRLYDGAQLQVATSAMDEMHLHSSASPEAGEAQVKLVGGDVLVGTLTGDIAVETSFNTVTLHTAELASLLPSRDSHARVTAVLSDGVTIRGRVACADVTCVTSAGVSVQVPLMLLSSYTQPRPHATDAQTETARALVAQLSADDWDARQQAQAKLAAMGPVIGDFLRGIRADQSPEGQQRIDAVLEGFEKQAKHKLPNEAANLDPSRLPTD